MGQIFPGLDHEPMVAELRDRLVEELDYVHEAANQRQFARLLRGPPHHPRPGGASTATRRGGCSPPSWPSAPASTRWSTWDQHQRDLAAETLYRFAFGSLYRLHVFNGDPHPGNYLFRPDGHVTFLDFGLVKHFTAAEIDDLRRDDQGHGDRATTRTGSARWSSRSG